VKGGSHRDPGWRRSVPWRIGCGVEEVEEGGEGEGGDHKGSTRSRHSPCSSTRSTRGSGMIHTSTMEDNLDLHRELHTLGVKL
jgi:hypothetical protein